ncbi:MAG TPA: DUF192 domain-containing protein [Sphingobium sp.]
MRALPLLTLALTLVLDGCKASPPSQDTTNSARPAVLSIAPLRVTTARGIKALTMEVAISPEEQERGLMHRTSLRPGHGMLFPFTLPQTASFWMKDTLIPLDLLFVRPNGSIAAILHGQPKDLHPLSAGEPVSAVVEIGGGEAQRLGIVAEDRLEWGDCREGRQQPGVPITTPLAFCPTAP